RGRTSLLPKLILARQRGGSLNLVLYVRSRRRRRLLEGQSVPRANRGEPPAEQAWVGEGNPAFCRRHEGQRADLQGRRLPRRFPQQSSARGRGAPPVPARVGR